MRGIILAGGTGSRLSPLTISVSKQLMPVYDKPMIYYPLSTLMLAGVTEVLLITAPRDVVAFERLLGDGSEFGISIHYAVQYEPRGLAEAFTIGKSFIDGSSVALILGDNIFYGVGLGGALRRSASNSGATIFGYRVATPRDYGVVEFDEDFRVLGLEEKPTKPKSDYAVPGLYFYDGQVSAIAEELRPSPRGELEITDLNRVYLENDQLRVKVLPRGTAWLDTGSFTNLLEAADFLRSIQARQGLRVGSPHEVGWRLGHLSDRELARAAERFKHSDYGHYLYGLLGEPEWLEHL